VVRGIKKGCSKLLPKEDHRRTGELLYVVLKKLAQISNLKMITGERAMAGTWH